MTELDARPPSFLRRHLAANLESDEVLVGLACDENMWVRREAVQNPATPRWVLDLLVRAGADPDLRGRSDPDPDMEPDEPRRLVECGPWAHQLVADHPNATPEILDALVHHLSDRIRAAVAAHPNASTATLAILCAGTDDEIRRRASTHAHSPGDVLAVMRRAGADAELASLDPRVDDTLDPGELASLARLGPWGRFLAGRHALCPTEVLAKVASDPDWRVRSAVLDNPATPDDMLAAVAGVDEAGAADDLRVLADARASAEQLLALTDHPQAEVRLAAARHPAATAEVVGVLAVDRVVDVRRLAAGHPLMDPDQLSLLIRAGSTADLARLATPDASIATTDLDVLSAGGYWARQLVVRHPDTAPTTLAHLLCDEDPKLREWAAAHPSAPADVVDMIWRAGGAQDFQGIAEGDPEMRVEELRRVAELGPWGAVVASWHPKAPRDLMALRNEVPVP